MCLYEERLTLTGFTKKIPYLPRNYTSRNFSLPKYCAKHLQFILSTNVYQEPVVWPSTVLSIDTQEEKEVSTFWELKSHVKDH